MDKLKNPAKYNSSNGGFASQGGLFAGKDIVQKQIKDAIKANLKRPNKQVGVKKKMRFQTQDLTKQVTYMGFTGEKAKGAHVKDTFLKNQMKEITFSSQRPTSPETGCDDILSNISNHIFSKKNQIIFFRPSKSQKPLTFENLHANQWDDMFEDSFKFSFGNKVEGVFFKCPPHHPPLSSTKIKKIPWSQPELLFHEILHLKEPLVGSLVFFIWILIRWGGGR